MTREKLATKSFSLRQKSRRDKAVSPIISTIIITSTLLIILVVASFVATNILNIQVVATEFDQAQTNMLLLDTYVQDISLRPGSGESVPFNQREGGIGIYQPTTSLTITVGSHEPKIYNNLVQFMYTGGPQATAAIDPSLGYSPLRGDPTLCVNMSQSLGFLRMEQDQGAKIKLDYDRVRITVPGLVSQLTNLVEITFIKLTKGSTSGSGTVNVHVQNIQAIPTTWTINGGTVNIRVQLTNATGTFTQDYQVGPPNSQVTTTVVVFSEIQVEASIT